MSANSVDRSIDRLDVGAVCGRPASMAGGLPAFARRCAAQAALDPEKTVRGEYEAQLLDRYRQECYQATSANFNWANREHPLYRPYVDEQYVAAGGPKPVWPGGAGFAVCLTHDVDFVAYSKPREHWRMILSQSRYLRRRRDGRAARGLRASLFRLAATLASVRRPDPLHACEQWMQMEAEVGAKSTFLFLPDRYRRPHYTDGGYRYTDRVRLAGQKCSVGEMMRETCRRGWEVGLHASWESYDCADEMKRQKEQVESAIDAPVESVRHHNLHLDIRCTPRVQHESGLRIDSSLGFNDNIGFRHGTCYPWFLCDLDANGPLDVLELPLVIQDNCLLEDLGCQSEELAWQWAEQIVQAVEAVGGVLTLLWHPTNIRYPIYVNVYRRLLTTLHQKGAWFGTMAEVGHWWRTGRALDTMAIPSCT